MRAERGFRHRSQERAAWSILLRGATGFRMRNDAAFTGIAAYPTDALAALCVGVAAICSRIQRGEAPTLQSHALCFSSHASATAVCAAAPMGRQSSLKRTCG